MLPVLRVRAQGVPHLVDLSPLKDIENSEKRKSLIAEWNSYASDILDQLNIIERELEE